jgi:DNA uptake protein ComE-like DNA-binding protein
LPAVGPVIARRSIEGRPYRTIEELLNVKGIGAKRLDGNWCLTEIGIGSYFQPSRKTN